MQPASYAPDLAHIKDAWVHFIATGQVWSDLDPLVALSWQRCAPRLNPKGPPQWTYLSDDVLPLTLSQHASLRTIACPLTIR